MTDILITGGTGCVGSNLAAALVHEGYHVRIFRRPQSNLAALRGIDVEHRIGDVADYRSLVEAFQGCDTVFHTAAIVTFARKRRDEQHMVNVIGTRNVVRACMAAGVKKLVHTSSIAAIGYPAPGKISDESKEFNWPNAKGYKLSKVLAETEVLGGVALGLPAVIVNPSVIIGERDIRFHGSQLIRDIKRGRIPVYIDGGMNVVYVQDVVRGMIGAALRGRTGERYILGGENLTHKEAFQRIARQIGGFTPRVKLSTSLLRTGAKVIERLSDLLGVEPIVTADLVAGAGIFNWYSSDKAVRELGYTITPFDEAVLATYTWYREQGYL